MSAGQVTTVAAPTTAHYLKRGRCGWSDYISGFRLWQTHEAHGCSRRCHRYARRARELTHPLHNSNRKAKQAT